MGLLRCGAVLFLVVFALILSTARVCGAATPPVGEEDRIWVQIIFTYGEGHTKTLQNGATIEFQSSRSGNYEGYLPRYQAYHGVDSFELNGPNGGSISVGDSLVSSGGGGSVVQSEQGTGAPSDDSSVNVHIDRKRGTYSLSFQIHTKTRVLLSGPGSPPRIDDNTAGLHYSTGNLPLPKTEDVIRGSVVYDSPVGSGSLGNNFVPQGQAMKQMDGVGLMPVHIRWQIGRPGPRPPLELLLSLEGYASWMPEGPTPALGAGKPGNQARVVAKLRRKDGKPLKRGAAIVRFQFNQNSAEPGACLNFPLEAQADPKDHDLRYVEGGDAKPTGADGQHAMTPVGDWREASAVIGAFDWGAYGAITATADVPEYGEVLATVEETGERELRLPKRGADSRIADVWKEQNGVGDLADIDDAEKSDGNPNDGDGLTLYEEYRGLFARGEHSRKSAEARLDPKRKDLAVLLAKKGRTASYGAESYALEPIGDRYLGQVRGGARMLEGAISRGHVVLINEDEAPASRILNANSAYAKKDFQHGVLLYSLKPPADGSKPADVGLACPLDRTKKRPGTTDFVAIDFASVAAGYAAQSEASRAGGEPLAYTLEQEISNTVAHELAHACGVAHHGDRESGSPETVLDETKQPPRYIVLGVDGAEVTRRPFELKGSIAGPESRSSGDPSCLMAYANAFAWRLLSERGKGYTWQAVKPGAMGHTLCTGRDGSPANQLFGPAAPGRGNCRAQLRVKDY